MPLVRMVDRQEVPPETQATFDAGEEKYGKVLDAWRVIAHNPGIFKAYFPFLQSVFAPGALAQRTKQLSAVRVTILNHSRYALSHRLDAAKKDGIAEEDLVALGDLAGNRDRFSQAELAALEFTDELTTRTDDVSFHQEPLVDALPSTKLALDARAVRDPGWTLGRWGSPAMLALALLALVLMAAGSLIGVE